MTGYTVHTGSSEKFSEGWDRIFSGSAKAKKKDPAKQSKTAKPATASKQRKGKK